MTQTQVRLDPEVLEKLRKIRALAEDARGESEGVTAMLMFQKLLTKHGVTESEVVFPDQAPDTVETVEALRATRHYDWVKVLHSTIGSHFRCIGITSTKYDRSVGDHRRVYALSFIGVGQDPLLAVEAFKVAKIVCEQTWERSHGGLSRRTTTADRNNYCLGFVRGLNAAYKEQEAKSELGIIIVRDKRVDDAIRGFSHHRIQLNTSNGSHSAMDKGFSDGKNFGRGNALPEHREALRA